MGFFRRISDLITPPPSQSEATQRYTPPPGEGDSEASARLWPQLVKLISADELNSPESTLAITELKHIASVIGLYIAASKMRFMLDAKQREEGRVLHKDRGYVLAADFIYQHVNKELQGLEAEGHGIGPNVFRSYCNELVACLVSGKNVRRAVEIPMLLVDNLLERSLMAIEHRDTYLSLIVQALESAHAQAIAKYESDQRERARRRQERKAESGSGSSSTAIEDPSHVLDGDTVEYIKEMGDRINVFIAAYSHCTAVPMPYAGSVPPDPAIAQRNLAFLQQVAPMAESAGYYGLIAIVAQRIASALSITSPDRQAEFWARCAMANELQADRENSILLFKLGKRRYKLAQDAYMKAGDMQRAAAAGQKIG
ncbi:MAG: hypothetical protein SGI88_15190 [Candidatus Hydrogenedentes bacterium]|nr:hypothetical protein [Candidatus Hydrogenedentota bacterium]